MNRVALRTAVLWLLAGASSFVPGQSLIDPATLPRAAARTPGAHGTTATSYVSIGPWQFDPIASSTTYDDLGAGTARASRFGTGGVGAFVAPVNLPNGSLLVSVEFDLCDSNASNNHVQSALEACDLLGETCAVLGGAMTSVSDELVPCVRYTNDLTPLQFTVDNLAGRLFLVARTHALDETNSISGALVGYRLQVSPAPATATFADVPTGHLFFRAIEALAASGITSGCGGGNYCPEQPVTRGEIAKFLANALGLQHP